MTSRDLLKHVAKNTIGYPEESVPVPSTIDWIRNQTRDPKRKAIDYFITLFPILGWIRRYNLGWFSGDLIAGITVGMVVVPQSMSYAVLATLPAQYGLYSSFVGVLFYCFFATSKDVSIGPVAVMSLTVSQIIKHVEKAHPNEWQGPQIAITVAFICGFIVLGIGLLRLGWIVEFISLPVVSGFMTGSAINIAAGQVPGLMGITGFDTRAATYRVIINTLKGLPRTTKDAAFGLTGLAFLYGVRMTCDYLARKYPRRARIFFFISVVRNAFVVLILTIAAWLYTRHRISKSGKTPIKILGPVPRGFKHVGSPHIDRQLVSALASQLPVATIILLLEHIAISKSFGRVNGYKINPNQELIAIGVTNTVGSVFGAYPATGSFSRSALKAKSGVRTPLAGIFTAVVVVVALYGLTPAFTWIPTAGISAVIIHAVLDLIAKPRQVYTFWRVSPLEFVIWLVTVLVIIFSTIENGIYTSICASLALLLIRISHPRGYFLGKVTLRTDSQDHRDPREVFVPMEPDGMTNSQVQVNAPLPGIIIYRFEDSLIYPNSSLNNSTLVDHVKAHTRRGKDMTFVKPADRPWNDPGPGVHGAAADQEINEMKPMLHAIVLDFSTISHIDTTGIQSLMDTRTEVERWANRPVEFHFATVLSPWIRRALIAGSFGIGTLTVSIPQEIAPAVPYSGGNSNNFMSNKDHQADDAEAQRIRHDFSSRNSSAGDHSKPAGNVPIYSEDTPFIHFDLPAAVSAAESSLRRVSSGQDAKK